MGNETTQSPLSKPPLDNEPQTIADSTVKRPSPDQADRITAGLQVSAEDHIDLGVAVIGERIDRWTMPTVEGAGSPPMTARVAGAGLSLVTAPTRLAPHGAANGIRLAYQPTAAGRLAGRLDLDFAKQHAPVKIPVTAKALGVDELLNALPKSFDVGEQVVGSEHVFTAGHAQLVPALTSRPAFSVTSPDDGITVTQRVEPPQANDSVPEIARIDDGAKAFSAATPAGPIGGLGAERTPLKLRFKPYRTGSFHADLLVEVRAAGEVAYHEIAISGRVRNLRDVAEGDERPPDPDPVQRPKLIGKREPTTTQVLDFDAAVDTARDNLAHLAERQKTGMDNAQDELLGGNIQTKKAPWYAALADLAILMGVGGVAQLVSKALAARLVALVGQTGVDAVKSMKVVDGLAAAMKDGMKHVAKGGLKSTAGRSTESGDVVVDFFARQREMLLDLAHANRTLITAERGRIQGALGDHPALVLAIFKELSDTFVSLADEAITTQHAATVSQWVSGVAREGLGSTTASRGGRVLEGTTTYLEHATYSPDATRKTKGLLELHASVSAGDLVNVNVDSAEIRGVSSGAFKALSGVPLRELPMPMRIHVSFGNGRTGIITRDELNRVLTWGAFPDDVLPTNRGNVAQQQLLGRKICDEVLWKSLAQWGVELQSDITGTTELSR